MHLRSPTRTGLLKCNQGRKFLLHCHGAAGHEPSKPSPGRSYRHGANLPTAKTLCKAESDKPCFPPPNLLPSSRLSRRAALAGSSWPLGLDKEVHTAHDANAWHRKRRLRAFSCRLVDGCSGRHPPCSFSAHQLPCFLPEPEHGTRRSEVALAEVGAFEVVED